jgi:hypothetical protein
MVMFEAYPAAAVLEDWSAIVRPTEAVPPEAPELIDTWKKNFLGDCPMMVGTALRFEDWNGDWPYREDICRPVSKGVLDAVEPVERTVCAEERVR